jgi:Cysteine-rich CWC
MCLHENKICPGCKKAFECKPGDITQCQCYGIELTAELKTFIEQHFTDCLCRECLQLLQQEPNFFKEKYSPE